MDAGLDLEHSQLYILIFVKLKKDLQEINKKNNTWNIRRLVGETIVSSTQHIIVKIVRFLNRARSLPILSMVVVSSCIGATVALLAVAAEVGTTKGLTANCSVP